ncbi:MAG: hypothetical protein ACXW1W_17630 [Methylococcaceae bacterium]
MNNSDKTQKNRDRTSLRLDAELIAMIDKARIERAGIVSRNTWISEAIQEKLGREAGYGSEQSKIRQGSN